MQRDGAARAPNEISGMGGDHQPGLVVRHAPLLFRTALLN
jgi:hypothetical protein